MHADRRRWLLAAAAGLGAAATCVPVGAQDARLPGSFAAWRRRFDIAHGLPDPDTLLAEGEALLAGGDAAAALEVLQRAANLAHTPPIECTITRAQAQAGAYRQALTFGAHAALSHRSFPAAMALYAWLLHAGGQSVIAARLLDEALQRAPDDEGLRMARQELARPWPQPAGPLLEAPLRCAPYAAGSPPDASPMRCAGTAVLCAGGHRALAPRETPAGAARIGLRNGLGDTVEAAVGPVIGDWVLLQLDRPLPAPPINVAARVPHAGSPVATIEFAPADSGMPAWPLLRQGFAGRVAAVGARPLGIPCPPGPRGGPVFDRAGHLAGVALRRDGQDCLVAAATLPLGHPAGQPGLAEAPLDAVYEVALRATLQLLVPQG